MMLIAPQCMSALLVLLFSKYFTSLICTRRLYCYSWL
uniref:Uncharacterized protein n=1 Tax=Arundo donax TaxID=35708 RepID=A0A0A9FD75_ARUDO